MTVKKTKRAPDEKKPDRGSGLPAPSAHDILLLSRNMDVVHASGRTLSVHPASDTGKSRPKPRHYKFDGAVAALAEMGGHILVAVDNHVLRIVGDHPVTMFETDGPVRSIAASKEKIFAAVGRTGRLHGTVVAFDTVQGAVAWERPVERVPTELSVDEQGSLLGLFDGRRFHTMMVEGATGAGKPASDSCDCGKCCECRGKDGKEGGKEGAADGGKGQEGGGDAKPGKTRDPCTDGDAGTVTKDGKTLLAQHGRVTICGLGPRAWCTIELFFKVRRIRETRDGYLVSDDRGTQLALLAKTDLEKLQEWNVGSGSVALAHPEQAAFMRYTARTQAWTLEQLGPMSGEGLQFEPAGSGDNVTWLGGSTPSDWTPYQVPTTGRVKVLVLACKEPGQSFDPDGMPGLKRYFQRTVFDRLSAYYQQNSFGRLEGVDFVFFFGGALGENEPIQLNKAASDYYFPAYDPARLELFKTIPSFPYELSFDGREKLTLVAQPKDGGRDAAVIPIVFYACIFQQAYPMFPVEIKFTGAERAVINISIGDQPAIALNLVFPASPLFRLNDYDQLDTQLADLETYLDTVLAQAESVLNRPTRLFAKPEIRRLSQETPGFGYLATTISVADPTGPKVRVLSVTSPNVNAGLAADPLGIGRMVIGTYRLTSAATASLFVYSFQYYLDWITTLAQERPGQDYTQRRLHTAEGQPQLVFDTPDRLTIRFHIGDMDGGPGASVTLQGSAGLQALFDASNAVPNSDVTPANSNAPKDGPGLINDAFRGAVERMVPAPLLAARSPLARQMVREYFHSHDTMMVAVIGSAQSIAGDDETVRLDEMWTASPSSVEKRTLREFVSRDLVRYMPFEDIQVGLPVQVQYLHPIVGADASGRLVGWRNDAVFSHEFGHALGFGDLYYAEGYRDELRYLGGWSLMDNAGALSHHIGYHKEQAGWIQGTRVQYAEPSDGLEPRVTEVLLVPIEYWPAEDAIVEKARSVFGQPDMDVVQLVYVPLGGDYVIYDQIEARQQRGEYSTIAAKAAVQVTNCVWRGYEFREAYEERYRRQAHLLNDPTQLTEPGESFDFAAAPELPAKGIKLEIVDRKTVVVGADAIEVFHIRVVRENKEYIDPYFPKADPYYQSPDVWVDWTGNNSPDGKSESRLPANHRHDYPEGQPRDQGEPVFVPTGQGSELHWIVARPRNGGQVQAEDVKINYFICEPAGAGDRGSFRMIASSTLPVLPPNHEPRTLPGEWNVDASVTGHTCVMVEIADWKIPRDSDGLALASDDVQRLNNKAQKNVSLILPKASSPYDPVDFDYSVNNSGRKPEIAFLRPVGLRDGMRLTVSPSRLTIPPGETRMFRCKLVLDRDVIDADCRSDSEFRLETWRHEEHAPVKWGGVLYKVRPRERTRTELQGYWKGGGEIELFGSVSPDPGGGTVRIWIAFDGRPDRWRSTEVGAGGTFSLQMTAPSNSSSLRAIACFDGNRKWSESRSPELQRNEPRPIN